MILAKISISATFPIHMQIWLQVLTHWPQFWPLFSPLVNQPSHTEYCRETPPVLQITVRMSRVSLMCCTEIWLEYPTNCACGKFYTIEYAFTCPKGGFPILWHNEIRNLTANLLTEVCHNVNVEPPATPDRRVALRGLLYQPGRGHCCEWVLGRLPRENVLWRQGV